MKRLFIFITIAILVMLSITTHSQTEALQNVNVKLNRESFSGTAFPFDEPFNIVGDLPDNCFQISYTYDITKRNKSWMSFPDTANFTTIWKKDGGKFSLYCPGMHPNIQYTFTINIFRSAVVSENVRKVIKQKLSDRLTKFAKDFSQRAYTDNDVNTLNSNLNSDFLAELNIICTNGTQLRSKCDPDKSFTLDISNEPILSEQFRLFKVTNNTIKDKYLDIYGTGVAADNQRPLHEVLNTLGTNSATLLGDIDTILKPKFPHAGYTKEILTLPFAPSSAGYTNYTLLDGLKILRKILITPGNTEQFLRGKLKIVNTNLEESEGIEYESIYLFKILLQTLADGAIQYKTDPSVGTMFEYITPWLDPSAKLAEVISLLQDHEAASKKLAGLIVLFPDLTEQIVLSDALTLETIPVADVVSEKTPYISVDGGIGYSTTFRSALSYYGANFYLSPVNKKTSLSKFKGFNKFKKMFCFVAAIGNTFGSRPANSFSILGESSNNDLLLGMGLRLNRVIKINGCWSLYKTNNTNTLAQDKTIKGDFIATIGIDVNLLKALGGIGRALNLIGN